MLYRSSSAGAGSAALPLITAISMFLGAGSALAQASPQGPSRSSLPTLPVAPYVHFAEVPTPPHIVSVAAASAPESIAQTPPAVASQWDVKTSDITLYRTLERWASAAGYKLKWDASRNFLIGAPDVYSGSFESALQTVLSSAGIRLSDYPLEACIYANTPPLVRITRQGEQARECSAAASE